MKILIILLFTLIISQQVFAQSIVIPEGASMYVPTGADICAIEYGNISGNLIGEGTQCGQYPLPVELVSFTAFIKDDAVHLYWVTETEVSSYGFEIEKSIKNIWEMIGFVEGNGNSNSPKSYSFLDKNLIGGSNFTYRLKQVDTDGQFEYSKEIEVDFTPTKFTLYQNYPNPFNPITKIRYQLPQTNKVVLKIYDILGTEIAVLVNEEKEPGIYEIEVDAMSLSSGTYIYRIVASEFSETKKMMLMK